MSHIGVIAEIFAVVSIIGHFIQHFLHKSQEKVLLGFLHGLKPLIESAAQGAVVPAATWAAQIPQINDMLARLQPPKKVK